MARQKGLSMGIFTGIGNSFSNSDSFFNKTGNMSSGQDGMHFKSGNMDFGSNGTTTRVGNMMFNADGSTSTVIGNTVIGGNPSLGATANLFGNDKQNGMFFG